MSAAKTRSAAWIGVGLCLVGHAALAVWGLLTEHPRTYVMTPYVEVVPGAAPLDEESAQLLAQELRGPVDARNIKHGYAWMGSTLSLQDLVAGINSLDDAGLPLSDDQRSRLGEILDETRRAHHQMLQVQGEILDLEARLERAVSQAVQALPPQQQRQLQARPRRPGRPGGPPPTGGAPPDRGGPPAPPPQPADAPDGEAP